MEMGDIAIEIYRDSEREKKGKEWIGRDLQWPRPGCTDSYRSLYLWRAISPQIRLKLMAFDTRGSGTLNSLQVLWC